MVSAVCSSQAAARAATNTLPFSFTVGFHLKPRRCQRQLLVTLSGSGGWGLWGFQKKDFENKGPPDEISVNTEKRRFESKVDSKVLKMVSGSGGRHVHRTVGALHHNLLRAQDVWAGGTLAVGKELPNVQAGKS